MGIKTTTFYDSGAARRRLIYVLCGVVLAGCVVSVFLLMQDGSPPEKGPSNESAKAPAKPTPARPDEVPSVEPPAENLPSPPPETDMDGLEEAHRLYDAAMVLVRKTRDADRGSKEAVLARRAALDALLETQEAYEGYLDAHPEAEGRLERRMAELQKQLYWCRKAMAANEFPTTGRPPEPSLPEPPPVHRPPPPPRTGPRRTDPKRPFRPEDAATRFKNKANLAFREGRPDRVVEIGQPLVDDPRMEGLLGDIPGTVESARAMVAFLESARVALSTRLNGPVRLDLRDSQIRGTLVQAGDEIVVRTEGGELRFHVRDLAAVELLRLAKASGWEETPKSLHATGAFLLLRGDEEEGARQLLLAKAGGRDISTLERRIERVLQRSPELKAFASLLFLRRLIETRSPEYPSALEKWKAAFRTTSYFEEHREELFRAYAEIVGTGHYQIDDLFSVPAKISGKRGINLVYPFDGEAELGDFESRGSWKVEGGELRGGQGTIWIERFSTKNVDLRFVLSGPATVSAGLWGPDRRGRGGVNLVIVPSDGDLNLNLKNGDRDIARKTVRMPRGPLEFVIQKRDRKYQIRLNRQLVLKGSQPSDVSLDHLTAIGILSRDNDLRIEELGIRTDLDMDWAKGGGRKFAVWIQDWHVAGPTANAGKTLESALAKKGWPETRPFSPADSGAEGGWRYFRGWLDLSRILRTKGRATAYAVVRVWSPDRRSAVLEVITDDDGRAWLNDDLVLREAPIGKSHRVPVRLEEGENVLLLKVVNSGGGWWAGARLLTRSGWAMRDLQYW